MNAIYRAMNTESGQKTSSLPKQVVSRLSGKLKLNESQSTVLNAIKDVLAQYDVGVIDMDVTGEQVNAVTANEPLDSMNTEALISALKQCDGVQSVELKDEPQNGIVISLKAEQGENRKHKKPAISESKTSGTKQKKIRLGMKESLAMTLNDILEQVEKLHFMPAREAVKQHVVTGKFDSLKAYAKTYGNTRNVSIKRINEGIAQFIRNIGKIEPSFKNRKQIYKNIAESESYTKENAEWTPAMAGLWLRIGEMIFKSATVAKNWWDAGFSAYDARRWATSGWSDPIIAFQYAEAGYEPGEAWYEYNAKQKGKDAGVKPKNKSGKPGTDLGGFRDGEKSGNSDQDQPDIQANPGDRGADSSTGWEG